MGFLTTSLHKNCQNDVKLLETWWFWPILGKVERAKLTCDVIKKSCSTFLIKFWLYFLIILGKTESELWIEKISEHGAIWVCGCGCVGKKPDKEGKFDLKTDFVSCFLS